MGAASFARAKALAQSGDGTKARALAESLLTAPNPELPESWWAQEWEARVNVLVAGLLGPEDAMRRDELLDRAREILTRPEAEGRITVDGRETMAKLTALRSEFNTSVE
jgi:hypothetical protein